MTIDRNSKNFSYPAQFGILLGLIGTGILIGFFISVITWLLMTGRPLLSMETDMLKPQYYSAVMTIQVLSTFLMFFLPAIFFSIICYKKPAKFLGFNININIKQVMILLGILMLTFPLSGALAELNKIIPLPNNWTAYFKLKEDTRAAEEGAFININSFPRYMISLIVIGFFPGLFEEIAFRAGLQNILAKWFRAPVLAIVLTAILFSLVHISYYGFLVRLALGIILGFIFYISGNIWLSVLFHFLYNGIQVTSLYFYTLSGSKDQKEIEDTFPAWAGIIAVLLIVFLFREFKKISLLQKQKLPDDDFPKDDFQNWVTSQS